MAASEDVRYGVFLVPDPRTSAAVTSITGYLRAQFGLLSAERFPPHVTLAGSLPLTVREAELLTAVQGVADRHRRIELVNAGLQRLGDAAIVFNVHNDRDGQPNLPLVNLAADVADVVRPLLRPTELLPADVRDRHSWRGHLSLASHELVDRADLRDEVEEFVQGLAVPYPATYLATRLTVYRLHHPSWSVGWWTDFWWEHVRSFSLNCTNPE